MKPFHTYRDGLPPTPGVFARKDSADYDGTPLRIGDIIRPKPGQWGGGLVVGIFGPLVVYLAMDSLTAHNVGEFGHGRAANFKIIGHSYNALRDIAKIESDADEDDSSGRKA